MNHKSVYQELSKYISNNCAFNIVLVIFGARPACWYDCWDITPGRMQKLLIYLDLFKKHQIYYKFDNNVDILNKVNYEGPLIYNKLLLSKYLIEQIENKDLSILYQQKIFGRILGYNCQVDIYKIKRKNHAEVDIYLQTSTKKLQVYGFYCKKTNIQKIKKRLSLKIDKMNNIAQQINKKYTVFTTIKIN